MYIPGVRLRPLDDAAQVVRMADIPVPVGAYAFVVLFRECEVRAQLLPEIDWRVLDLLERGGAVLWQRIAPSARGLLPVTSPWQALALGFLFSEGVIEHVDEIVGAALFLASDASSFVTGSVLTVDGGTSA